MHIRSADTTIQKKRPLSPHLQVWRWHATMATSILHRASGSANYIGAGLMTLFLVCLAGGPESYQTIAPLFQGGLGIAVKVVLFLLAWSYGYHWLNGLRHLMWDAGLGFGPKTSNRNSWIIMIASPLPAVLIFALALGAN
ncbi:succinate dehydrogenase, cytochrome b556 subunit [Marinicauda algicola]|uniref:Succinate dehydrogenase cytochrome b556 subunit n=1 Tax=Marinicauda algicola TaxID=2029849 RepID=A0A4S2H125_9PROT|nr:succinate dehydrogenase, cytochrome b556 subunit [Marinicauda algicola]TGY89103.1 succinate dehydrogenase, cytochrome b556 subunit [Marinicauda algicola]